MVALKKAGTDPLSQVWRCNEMVEELPFPVPSYSQPRAPSSPRLSAGPELRCEKVRRGGSKSLNREAPKFWTRWFWARTSGCPVASDPAEAFNINFYFFGSSNLKNISKFFRSILGPCNPWRLTLLVSERPQEFFRTPRNEFLGL